MAWRPLAIVLALLCALLLKPSAGATRPFAVRDSIELARVARDYLRPEIAGIHIAPGAARFVTITFRGNLSTGRNEYALNLYETADVLAYLNSESAPLPAPHVLARSETDRPWPEANAIDAVRWRNDREIMFIARNAGARVGLFQADVPTRSVSELFPMPPEVDNVQCYDVSGDGRFVLFSTYQRPDWSDRIRRGYVIDPWIGNAGRLQIGHQQDAPADILAFYLADRVTARVERLPMSSSGWPTCGAFSPSGRWAVIPTKVLPDGEWLQYDEIGQRAAESNPTGVPALFDARAAFTGRAYTQYMLVDVERRTARPLLDAPSLVVGQFGASAASLPVWLEGEESVVVGPTYLPLSVTGEERARREAHQVVAEVDLATGEAIRITDVPEMTYSQFVLPLVTTMRGEGAGQLVLEFARPGETRSALVAYRRRSGRWVRAAVPTERSARALPIEVRIREAMNAPPEIVARDVRTGAERPITQLNPQLAAMDIPQAREFRWQGEGGNSRQDLLFLPPGYRQGQLYPVVIQIGSRRIGEFQTDGGNGTTGGYAARALAARGMVVLQLPYRYERPSEPITRGNWDRLSELGQFRHLVQEAIRALVREGVADQSRIGITGFSRSGMYVEYALANCGCSFAAAAIADSTAATPATYAFSYPLMSEWEQDSYIGAPFWGEGRGLWYERSPTFHLEDIRTPIRIERYGRGYTPRWETYALLRRMRRPAEMVHIPNAGHVLTSPATRYTSQEGLVDWFDFWLNGHEDPDPQKREQYLRWQRLRAEWLLARQQESRQH